MHKKQSDYKLGLFYNKNSLLPLSSVELNIQIINKYVNVQIIQKYKNPFKQSINSTFFIPKEYVQIFKSLKIYYNNQSFEGIICNKTNIIYSDEGSLEISEYHDYRKKYLFFYIKDILPEEEIKIQLNYIDIIEPENNYLKYIIPDKFIPNNQDNINYKYEIKIQNTKKIGKIYCNKNNFEIKKIYDNEYLIKYSGIQKNNEKISNNNKLIIEFEIEEKEEPDIIVMKHPIYENDYACYFSLNLKNIIKEKKEINNKDDYIIIFINNEANNLKGVIKSIIYLLKSLPEKNCKFNILERQLFFKDFIDVNENNIKKTIDLVKTNDYYGLQVSTNDKIKIIESQKNIINKVFIIGGNYYSFANSEINNIIDKFSDTNCKFYTIGIPIKPTSDITPIEEIERFKEISRKTKGNWTDFYDRDGISDKVIEIYEESLNEYINNLNIDFTTKDKNLKIIKHDKYSVNSTMELLINMSMNNKIMITFDYKGKKYEYEYNINIDGIIRDDMLHKIFYFEYYKLNMYLEAELINILNKYQILTNLNELNIESINNAETLNNIINKKIEKNIIFKPKGTKLNLFMKYVFASKNEITLYSLFTIKEVKIINELITKRPHKNQRYIYYGKCMEDNRILEDYCVKNGKEINCVLTNYKFIPKSYFYVYDNINLDSIVNNQQINGVWPATYDNVKLLNNSGILFDDFYQKIKDNYSIDNKHFVVTILCLYFLRSFPYKKRIHFIIEKAVEFLKEKIDFNEEMIRKLVYDIN